MRGDFARVTFEPLRHFTQVLQNQGRVQLEADWNEQGAIMLHLIRTLIVDVVGRAWRAGGGFALAFDTSSKLTIAAGHFYVDGVLCQNEADVTYETQPWRPLPDGDPPPLFHELGMVYLDAWERHVTAIESPELREVALGGPETASRAQVVWQVRALSVAAITARLAQVDLALDRRQKLAAEQAETQTVEAIKAAREALATLVDSVTPAKFKCENARQVLAAAEQVRGRLRATSKPGNTQNDLCSIPPENRYRGLENQLYRIEVHKPGLGDTATFKWSRENGSVSFPILGSASPDAEPTVRVGDLGPDSRLGLCAGDWVEYVDDDVTLAQRASPLIKVIDVDRGERTVKLARALPTVDVRKHPLLRRWDQQAKTNADGTLLITESGDDGGWIPIEDGISVQFLTGGLYATGDFWVCAARTATGDVEWPWDTATPPARKFVPPRGVAHHLASLGVLKKSGPTDIDDACVCVIKGLCS